MKLRTETPRENLGGAGRGVTKKTPSMNPPEPGPELPQRLRRLKWNELVSHGDFIADGHRGFELWDGPTGFRADAFVKPIYRRDKSRAVVARKAS